MSELLLLGLGSNSNAEYNIESAMRKLQTIFGCVVFTQPMRTAPISGKGPAYLNAVASVQTDLSADEIKKQLKKIEEEQGRNKKTPEIVSIDIDILALGQQIIPEMNIPSDDLVSRKFCLFPAAAIAPDFIHPTMGKNLLQLSDEFKEG